ncbi:MAG: glucose-6-phosphate isomerase [Acidobacteria bacterium]|nr:glucose-6-phosphate isomerase [Acidobacteriota bacterium]
MTSRKLIRDLQSIFRDAEAYRLLDPELEVYRVQWCQPVDVGTEGGLFWGVTTLQPGKVGDEYFMTHGHYHANRTRAEYYAAVRGKGILLRMDQQRNTWGEEMFSGSIHYISGRHAHRVVNVGDDPLVFWACWASDAGYDYETIRSHGFSSIVVDQGGQPAIVQST